jgi:hypothetical protein
MDSGLHPIGITGLHLSGLTLLSVGHRTERCKMLLVLQEGSVWEGVLLIHLGVQRWSTRRERGERRMDECKKGERVKMMVKKSLEAKECLGTLVRENLVRVLVMERKKKEEAGGKRRIL